ncbi:MAG: AAA family ATPase, partial [Planctomycetota bacterium]
MRFLELYFPAFGPFTDVGIQLSGGDRGLHVIYGPNEAGKSSTMRAIRGLLFGIPLRSQDDFVHESRKLLVGAKVRCEDGSDFVFLRRKGRKDTVLDLDRKPIPDAEVADLLGGMNEATYRQLFGIDHDDLIAGGREILSGGGEIGEALFSAALGGHGLRALVRDLETEAAELYVPRGKKKRVNVSLAEFKEIRAQLRDSTLSFAEWETKHSELSSSRERVQDLERQVSRSRAEKQRVESDARAIVHAKALERVRCELAEFGDFPRLRESFSGELHDALLSRERAHQGGVKLTERLKRVDRDLESVVVDSDVLAQGQLVDSFYQRLGVVLKDRDELSELERELALSRDSTERRELEVRAELDATRASSDGDSPDGLRIEPGEEIRLRELADQLVRHDARLEELSTELGDLEGEYEKRSRDLEEHEAVDDPAPLRAVVQSLSSEFFDEVDRAQVEAVERRERAEAAFRRVTMWSESAEDLEAKKFPLAETVERFEARFSENERRSDQVAAELARLSTRRGESEAQLRELEADGGELPSEDSLATRRERRDELWRDIRGQLRKPQEGWEVSREDHFERESRLADEVSDRLRRE